jgi:SAM-dependent methyltransferase
MKIQEKMKRDWDRRAEADPYYWVAATQEADLDSYHASAERDCAHFLEGLKPIITDGFNGALLDLGCGIGRMTAPLAAHFDRAVGVDVSPLMIKQAQSLHNDIDNLEFIVNSGADLSSLDSESFKVICSYSVLPHLPPDVVNAYFSELGRVLAPQGLIRYQFWVGPSLHLDDHDTLGIHVYEESEVSALHQLAGLEEVSREEIDYFDPILKLRPVWINARKVSKAMTPNPQLDREVSSTLGDEEQRLEYDLMLHLALRYEEQNRRTDAEGILEKATQLDRQRPEGYLHWAELRIGQDDVRGALMLLEELTTHCPHIPQGWLLRAQVSIGEGEYLKANALLKNVALLNMSDNDPEKELYLALKKEATKGHLANMKMKHKRKNIRTKGRRS